MKFRVEDEIRVATTELKELGKIPSSLHIVDGIFTFDALGGFWKTRDEDFDKFPRLSIGTTRRKVFENKGYSEHDLTLELETNPNHDKRAEYLSISEEIILKIIRNLIRKSEVVSLPVDNELEFTFQALKHSSKHNITSVNITVTFIVDKVNLCIPSLLT